MPGGMLPGLVEGEANRPGRKWPRGVVLVELLPECQGCLLEDIPGILRVGQDRANVSMDVPFRLQEAPEELAAVVGWGRVSHASDSIDGTEIGQSQKGRHHHLAVEVCFELKATDPQSHGAAAACARPAGTADLRTALRFGSFVIDPA